MKGPTSVRKGMYWPPPSSPVNWGQLEPYQKHDEADAVQKILRAELAAKRVANVTERGLFANDARKRGSIAKGILPSSSFGITMERLQA
jgi:hypothetical protein